MLSGYSKKTVLLDQSGNRKFVERSNVNQPNPSGRMSSASQFQVTASNIAMPGGGLGGYSMSAGSIGLGNIQHGILDGILPTTNRSLLNKLFVDIYYHDCISGSVVDLISNLPFSDFSLSGIKDQKVLKVYMKNIDNMRLKTLLPNLAVDYFVLGNFIGSLNFSAEKKIFTNIIPQNSDLISFTQIPIYGVDPLMKLKFPKEMQAIFTHQDPRVKKIVSSLPQNMIEGIKKGELTLDPSSTLFIPRRTFSTDQVGVSLYRRILPLYLLEKTLLRGTIDLAHRRQKSALHIACGDDVWEPTPFELDNIASMFLGLDADPVSAVVATRQGIQANPLQSAQDFWSIGSDFQFISEAKLKAFGVSDGLLSGDASYGCLTGDSLISTNKGIIRIDKLVDEEQLKNAIIGKAVDINYIVKSKYGKSGNAIKWLYNGIKDVYKVSLKGSSITGTPNHPLLVFNGSTEWKRIDQLKKGDMVCIDQDPNFKDHNGNNDYYKTSSVQNIEYFGKQKTYDISMKPGTEPCFVANGIVVHNTSETAMNVFLQQLLAFRNTVTRELFYDKFFPSIAVTNDFKKRKNESTYGSTDEDGYYIQGENKILKDKKGNLIALCDGSGINNIQEVEDITKYQIPKIHWHKELKPEGNQTYMAMLNELQQMGLPLPIRVIAAAGGFNIDEIIAQSEDDLQIRARLKQYGDQVQQLMVGDQNADGAGGQEQSSVHETVANYLAGVGKVRPKGLLNRVFDDPSLEPCARDKNGKRRVTTRAEKARINEKMNRVIAQAASRLHTRLNYKEKKAYKDFKDK